MKRIFQRRLLFFVIIAFLLASAGVGAAYVSNARKAALVLIRNNLDYVELLIKKQDENNEDLAAFRSTSDAALLNVARSLADYIDAHPESLKDQDVLDEYRRANTAATVYVTDGRGVVAASSSERMVGLDISANSRTRIFATGLSNSSYEKVVSPTATDADDLQYVVVARRDAPGLIFMEYDSSYLKLVDDLAGVGEIQESFCKGFFGELRMRPNRNNETEERVFSEKCDGKTFLCVARPCGEHVLTGGISLEEIYFNRAHVFFALAGGCLLLAIVSFVVVSRLLQKLVIDGIYDIDASLDKITRGDLSVKVDSRLTPEFASLSDGVNIMVDSLKKSIEREKTRIDAELKLCRVIQTSLLPNESEFAFSDEYRLAATMTSAKMVGGDFYDFFSIDDDRFVLLIADVSDKGITAAMYMTSAKLLLKNLFLSGLAPEEVFNEANRQLCRNNKAAMFMTAFAIVVERGTGRALGVNAGHCSPLFKRASGAWEFKRVDRSFPLGVTDDARYVSFPFEFHQGDAFFSYTDGVTEATNKSGSLFGESRLEAVLSDLDRAPEEVVKLVRAAIDEFADGAPQSDDVTMVCLERRVDLSP